MKSFKYTGAYRTITIAEIVLTKDKAVQLENDQAKRLEENGFGKALIDKGDIVEVKGDEKSKEPETDINKPVSKMTVPELEAYITANGGEFSSDDNKPELLEIAQAIEASKETK